jgi:hypothetical protein
MENKEWLNYQQSNANDVDTNGFQESKPQSGVPSVIAPIGTKKGEGEQRKIKICLQCGKEYHSKKKTSKFCSKECTYIGRPKRQKQGEQRNCKLCGKIFNAIPSETRRGRALYCSRNCLNQSRRTRRIINCLICNKPFLRKSIKHRFCSRQCFINATGKGIIHYKKVDRLTHKGYMSVLLQKDSFYYSMSDYAGYIAEHRYIMAQSLGRCLQKWEIVHHKNGIKSDNRIENLELVSRNDHIQAHGKGYSDGYAKGLVDGKTKQIKLLNARITQLENQLNRETQSEF